MKIVRVSAIWCPSCILMRPIYDEIVKKYNLESEELDFDFDEDKVLPLNVGNKLPVVIIYKDNEEKARIIGEKRRDEIEKVFEGLV